MPHADTAPHTALFRELFRSWTPDEIVAYYRSRTTVQYLPELSTAEVTRAKIDSILGHRFAFNGEEHSLPAPLNWTINPSTDVEWLIMLHKFYYAVGLGLAYHETGDVRYAETWIALTDSWIAQVELDFLTSDVMGRRVQNWIFAHFYFVTLHPECPIPSAFYLKFLDSLARQVCYLCEHLTPERNHRTLELCAIFTAAVVFPELEEAEHWLAFATHELWLNMQADLLPDGVQRELSTEYHHIVLRNFLGARTLAFLNDISLPEGTDQMIRRALDFALYIHKPDGTIPSLSDGDSGSFLDLLRRGNALYDDPAMLYVTTKGAHGTPPAARSKGFETAGYYILRSGWGDGAEPYEDERYLVFDCGPLGAGNHGHLDLLSFEMAAYGRSLIVDPGRCTYDEAGATNWRARFRGTSYHNTVLVDGKHQTRYEHHKTKHKIKGPQPEHELRAFVSCAGFDFLHGIARSHEYPVVHERSILFLCPEYWIVTDLLRAAEPHCYDLLFHLGAAAFDKVVATTEQHTRLIDAPHLVFAQAHDPQVVSTVEDGFVSPSYGVKHRAPIVRFARRAADAGWHTILYPYKTVRPSIRVARLPVFDGERLCSEAQAAALSITITTLTQSFNDVYAIAHQPPAEAYTIGELTLQNTLLFLRKDAHGHVVRRYIV